ncbi:hypothetical protein GW17_00053760 [Ensete ventricosum]|nr:hypothetical protein GW17_00053760 [Ensete ventricosum]
MGEEGIEEEVGNLKRGWNSRRSNAEFKKEHKEKPRGQTSMDEHRCPSTTGVVQAGLFPGTYCDGWHFRCLLRCLGKEEEGTTSFDRGGVPPTATPPRMHKWLRMRVVASNIGHHKKGMA